MLKRHREAKNLVVQVVRPWINTDGRKRIAPQAAPLGRHHDYELPPNQSIPLPSVLPCAETQRPSIRICPRPCTADANSYSVPSYQVSTTASPKPHGLSGIESRVAQGLLLSCLQGDDDADNSVSLGQVHSPRERPSSPLRSSAPSREYLSTQSAEWHTMGHSNDLRLDHNIEGTRLRQEKGLSRIADASTGYSQEDKNPSAGENECGSWEDIGDDLLRFRAPVEKSSESFRPESSSANSLRSDTPVALNAKRKWNDSPSGESLPEYDTKRSKVHYDQQRAILWMHSSGRDYFHQYLTAILAQWGVTRRHRKTCVSLPASWAALSPMTLMGIFEYSKTPLKGSDGPVISASRSFSFATVHQLQLIMPYPELQVRRPRSELDTRGSMV